MLIRLRKRPASQSPWYELPELAPDCCLFGATYFDRMLHQFYLITERLHNLQMEQRDRMCYYSGVRRLLDDTRRREDINAPDVVIQELETLWKKCHLKLTYAGRRIHMLMSRVQHELCPILKLLHRQSVELQQIQEAEIFRVHYSLLCERLWIYHDWLYIPISEEINRCEVLMDHYAETGLVIERDLEILPWWRRVGIY